MPGHSSSDRAHPLTRPLLIAGCFCLLVLGATVLAASTLEAALRHEGHEEALLAGYHIQTENREFMAEHLTALASVDAFFAASHHVSREEFSEFASRISLMGSGFRSIDWLDRKRDVRWGAPAAGHDSAPDLAAPPWDDLAARKALESAAVTATDPVSLSRSGHGYLLCHPLREDGKPSGVIFGMVKLERHLDRLQLKQLARNHRISLTDGSGKILFASGEPGPEALTFDLPVGDRHWSLRLQPKSDWQAVLPIVLTWLVGGLLIIGIVAFVGSDIFAARRLKREVDTQTEDLRKSRDQLEIILNGVTDGIVAFDSLGSIIFSNAAAGRISGYPASFFMERSSLSRISEAIQIQDREGNPLPLARNPAARALMGERVEPGILKFVRGDGQLREVVLQALPVLDPDGQVQLAIVIFHDLTELQQAERLKSEFLSAVTHELRTPLTSIKGYAEFLEDGLGGTLSDEQLGFVEQIQAGTHQLERLVDDLLDFARIESGTFSLKVQPTELNRLVQQVVESFRPQAMERAIAMDAVFPASVVSLEGDPNRLSQVIGNLVSNALKFTPEGGRVRLALRETEEEAVIEVSDSGIGISPDHLPRLFTRFFQVDSQLNRSYKGTGLGLAITKGLVEAHSGRIEVTSVLGEGSAFTVTLPRHQPRSGRDLRHPSGLGTN